MADMGDRVTGSEPRRRITIYDIAKIAGTSASAVSAVLNGKWQQRRISAQLAERVTRIAQEQGYARNLQASALRRDRSNMIGMIIPKYDNRYFGSIAEEFEARARARGMFPIVTCTRREPELELAAARAMVSHRVDWLVATGATDPDRISDLCAPAGVQTINLDLPGTRASSVISDNFAGAQALTARVLTRCREELGASGPLLFVGGRQGDHNTAERIRGFRAAHAAAGISLSDDHVLACGYAAAKAELALAGWQADGGPRVAGMFVNSTITLEGVMRWVRGTANLRDSSDAGRPAGLRLGCFDWDPFAALLDEGIDMVRQDVPAMLDQLFALMEARGGTIRTIQIPPIMHPAGVPA